MLPICKSPLENLHFVVPSHPRLEKSSNPHRNMNKYPNFDTSPLPPPCTLLQSLGSIDQIKRGCLYQSGTQRKPCAAQCHLFISMCRPMPCTPKVGCALCFSGTRRGSYGVHSGYFSFNSLVSRRFILPRIPACFYAPNFFVFIYYTHINEG